MKRTNKFFLCNFFSIFVKIKNNYYQKNKEKLGKQALERYQNVSEEEKEKNEKGLRKISKFN